MKLDELQRRFAPQDRPEPEPIKRAFRAPLFETTVIRHGAYLVDAGSLGDNIEARLVKEWAFIGSINKSAIDTRQPSPFEDGAPSMTHAFNDAAYEANVELSVSMFEAVGKLAPGLNILMENQIRTVDIILVSADKFCAILEGVVVARRSTSFSMDAQSTTYAFDLRVRNDRHARLV